MKRIYTIAIAILLSYTAQSQLFMLPFFTGTTFFGSYGVTVTSGGSVSSGGALACLAPTTDQYWIGYPGTTPGPGAYTYTLTRPVYKIAVHAWGINGGAAGSGEYMSMFINGSPHPLVPADITSYTECSPGGGLCYLSTGFLMGPVGLTSDYNGGDILISSSTGITSFECYTNGITSGIAYVVYLDTSALTVCQGDTLQLVDSGSSVGATYLWSGPLGFTSTLQNPFIYPALLTDSGVYMVVQTIGAVSDTMLTVVRVNPKPTLVVTNNSPLCSNQISALDLYAAPDSLGETFIWKGPAGFTSTGENPVLTTFSASDTGTYTVYATNQYGCKDTGTTHVIVIQQPPKPVVTDENYCQGNTFVAYAISDTIGGDTLLWYTVATGGTPSTTPATVNTLLPGMNYVWVSEKFGGCESLRGMDSVRVTTTPPAPAVTGIMQYCQFIGPVIPLTVSTTPTGVARWYTSASGTSYSPTEPSVDITNPGTYNWWVSQIDSGCEGPRTPVTLVIHPKPNKPIINPTPICQFQTPVPVSCSPDTTGIGTTLISPNPFLWYGTGVTPGMSIPPVPATNIAPDTLIFYVTETTVYGCISDSAVDIDVIKVKPPVPVTNVTRYCQYANAAPLNALVDSIGNSHLNWYYNAIAVPPTPSPVTDTLPGTYTWFVSQTVPNNATGCESDSAAVNVTIIYKPVFDILPLRPYVCQFDSIRLSYNPLGQQLFAPAYKWVLPSGAVFAAGTNQFDSTVMVQFDQANMNNYVFLYASDDSGFCTSDTSVYVKVIAQPYMSAFTKPDVCLGDTVQLALNTSAADANNFNWYIDNTLLTNSPSINIIVSNSNSAGPYKIKWIDTGLHVIKVTGQTSEGCKSLAAFDSVNVHQLPDASFQIMGIDSANEFCLQDSAHFRANSWNTNYAYAWSPASYFSNLNKPDIWGKMDNTASIVTLTVKDPFGCIASSSQTLYPGTCCTVIFPNAFTPGGTINRLFRPIMTGFHSFKEFRIVNRWGTTIFEGGNTNVSWDGNYNGVPQDMGVYYYFIRYDCGGKTIEAKGDLTLIR